MSQWFHEYWGTQGATNTGQPDLGIFFLSHDVICTTDIAFLNLGLIQEALPESSLSLETLGNFLHERMIDVGKDVRAVLDALEIEPDPTVWPPASTPPMIGYLDAVAKDFYELVSEGLAPGRVDLGLLLTMILAQLNTACRLSEAIDPENQIALFKLRYTTLFHVASSLSSLLDGNKRKPFFLASRVRQIEAGLNDDSVRFAIKNRALRNTLVHYVPRKSIRNQLCMDLPLVGLVEALAGVPFCTAATTVTHGLNVLLEVTDNCFSPKLSPQGIL